VATYLDRILLAHRAAAAADGRSVEDLRDRVGSMPAPRGFAGALRRAAAGGELAVVAEIKRRSPSRGDLVTALDPATVGRQYEAGGAACLSVLTDAEFFGGSADDLVAARDAVAVPVLRKDFTVCATDVYDARIMGADAVLLIVAALADAELAALSRAAADVGIDALVEVHDEEELARALAVGATLVGVNQRDLATFEVDRARAERVVASIPDGVVAVAESGVRGPADAQRLADAGYHAVLAGESVVTAGDRVAAVASLRVKVGARW
jgi:indole-3-glycerol phosphate synthase